MQGYLNAISVPAIAIVVYCVIAIIKQAVGENEKFKRFIPLIAAVLGVACGIICFYALPSIIPADNIVVAIVIGGASGLTATATNQIFKQLGKKSDDKSDKDSESDNATDTEDTTDKADEIGGEVTENAATNGDSVQDDPNADKSDTDVADVNEIDNLND